MKQQFIRRLLSIIAAPAVALLVMAFTGSDGEYLQERDHAKCDTFKTFYAECETSWQLGSWLLCAGTCQAYKFDRTCGFCRNMYGGSCASYTGRIAVVSQTEKRDCTPYMFMGVFSACTCPALGSFTPVGTVGCGCADPFSLF